VDIRPPQTDDLPDRTRFYTFLCSELVHRKETMSLIMQAHDATERRMHQRMDEMHKLVDEMDRKVRHDDTRMKTIIASAAVVWALMSGAMAWVWERGTRQVDTHVTQLQGLAEESRENARALQALQGDVNALKGLRGQIQTLQEDLNLLRPAK